MIWRYLWFDQILYMIWWDIYIYMIWWDMIWYDMGMIWCAVIYNLIILRYENLTYDIIWIMSYRHIDRKSYDGDMSFACFHAIFPWIQMNLRWHKQSLAGWTRWKRFGRPPNDYDCFLPILIYAGAKLPPCQSFRKNLILHSTAQGARWKNCWPRSLGWSPASVVKKQQDLEEKVVQYICIYFMKLNLSQLI